MSSASRHAQVVALAGGVAALAFVSSAFAGDDKSTMTAVMELVGVSSDQDVSKIDYSDRPKLVLPSSINSLPAPRATANRPSNWPADMSSENKRNSDRYMRIGNAPVEKKPGILESALSFGQGKETPVVDEPNRSLLTEPPTGYRRPTQDLSKLRDSDAKKGSWWNPLTHLSGGGAADNDTEANPAAPDSRGVPRRQVSSAATGSASSGGGSSSGGGLLSALQLPRILRGSDSD